MNCGDAGGWTGADELAIALLVCLIMPLAVVLVAHLIGRRWRLLASQQASKSASPQVHTSTSPHVRKSDAEEAAGDETTFFGAQDPAAKAGDPFRPGDTGGAG